jgi:predicted RNA binding protein YcfA (HicA-like mRNA interferase family)
VQKEIKPKEIVRALLKMGFYKLHQKGSHLRLGHPDGRKVTIALHPKPISRGTLASILRQSRITRKELDKFL